MNREYELYKSCRLCPRYCEVDRTSGSRGFCGQPAEIVLASALLHGGEEPPISGENGSGTLFFTGCTLKCSFCQNSQLSRENMGRRISEDEFADICLTLQDKGAHNINLVTASQFIPSVISGIKEAKSRGLTVPVLWNSSGYETEESVNMLKSEIDIFLPDFKTSDPSVAGDFFRAPDYPGFALKAIKSMTEGAETDFSIIETGKMMKRGVVIRHLVLPDYLESTEKILRLYSENFSGKAILSVMFQYSPEAAGKRGKNPERAVYSKEADIIYDLLDKYGIEEGFIQETENTSGWIPDFNSVKPFPESESRAVWHWKKGFIA